jgi:hypothetical protein
MLYYSDVKQFNEYINGTKFHANCSIKYSFDLKVKKRNQLLADLVKDTKIIHVGCVDHLDLIEEKIRANTWLHTIDEFCL